jgi:hypothetical protein
VPARVGKRLAVSKQAARTFDGKRFNFRKLNEMEIRKQYQIEIKNRFAPLRKLIVGEDINRTWQNVQEDIKT